MCVSPPSESVRLFGLARSSLREVALMRSRSRQRSEGSNFRVEAGALKRTPSASRGLPEWCQHRRYASRLSPLCRSAARWRVNLFTLGASSLAVREIHLPATPPCKAYESRGIGEGAVGK